MNGRTSKLLGAVLLSSFLHLGAAAVFYTPEKDGSQQAGQGGLVVSLGPKGRAPGDVTKPQVQANKDKQQADRKQRKSSEHEDAVEDDVVRERLTEKKTSQTDQSDINEDSRLENKKQRKTAEDSPRDPGHTDKVVRTEKAEVSLPSSSKKGREKERNAEKEKAKRIEPSNTANREITNTTRPAKKHLSTKRNPKTLEHRRTAQQKQTNKDAPAQSAKTYPGHKGESGVEGPSRAGSGDNSHGGGDPAAAADYFSQLRAWLEKHKQYPRLARLRQEQGVAVLRFVVSRSGEVLRYDIDRSSGYRLLDNEVREMIERAQPLPQIPPTIHHSKIEVRVPVQFMLR